MEYHAHIYWRSPVERERAMMLRPWLEKEGCIVGQVWDTAIGPHSWPMYQVIYDSHKQKRIESFLRVNRETNSILLHESIKDDFRDHTEGARWLGEELSLRLWAFKEQEN